MQQKKEEGSILVLVILVFAVILLLGTVTMAMAQYSQTYAIRQVDRQQGYYVAKTGVDIAGNYVLGASNKNGQVVRINELMSGTSTFEMTDNKGYIWDCEIDVTSASPQIEIVSKATNRSTNTTRMLKGVLTDGGEGSSSQIRSFNNIKIDTITDVDFVDANTDGGGVTINSEGKISVENIYSFGDVHLETDGTTPSNIRAGTIWTDGASGQNITIESNKNVTVTNILGKECSITAAGDVTITGTVAVNSLRINVPSGSTITIDPNNTYTNQGVTGNYYYTVVRGGSSSQVGGLQNRSSAPVIPGNATSAIDETSIPFTNLSALVNTGILYFEDPVACVQGHSECLTMKQIDAWGVEHTTTSHILPDDPARVRPKTYYKLDVLDAQVRVLFQNFDGRRGDGTKEKYNIFISTPFPSPLSVTFNNCRNTAFWGNINTQIGGFNIVGDADGLQFGTPPYSFVGYKE